MAAGVEEAPCGGWVDAEHGGLLGVDAGREDEEVGGWADDGFGPCAAGAERDDEVAGIDVRDIGAEGVDDADAFHAWGGGEVGFAAVGAFDEVEVGGIYGGEAHAEADFAGAGDGVRGGDDGGDGGRGAGFPEQGGAHLLRKLEGLFRMASAC